MSQEIIPAELIQKTAGETAFTWASALNLNEVVGDFQAGAEGVSATICGHRAQLSFRKGHLEGHCDCLESEGFDFCRHCAALALYSNRSRQQLNSLARGPEKSRVLAYLLSLDKHALARECLQLLEKDPEQLQYFSLKACIEGDHIDFPTLRKELTRITKPAGKLFSQRQVKHFFARIERLFDALEHADSAQDPERFLKLVEYAWQRINGLLDTLDDTSGQSTASAEKLTHLYRKALDAFPSRPATKANRVLRFWLEDRHQLLGTDLTRLLDKEAIQHFNQQALKEWQACDTDANVGKKKRLARYLLQLPQTPSLEQAQSMRMDLAESDSDWIRIAEQWLENGDPDKAISTLKSHLLGDTVSDILRFYPLLRRCWPATSQRLQGVKDLFEQSPSTFAGLLLRCIDEEEPDSHIRQQNLQHCIEILVQRDRDDERILLLQLLLRAEDYQGAHAVWLKCEEGKSKSVLDLDMRIQLARGLVASQNTEAGTLHLKAIIKALLAQSRHRSDELAAQLLSELQPLLHSVPQALERYLDSIRPLLQSRPNFLKIVRNRNNTLQN